MAEFFFGVDFGACNLKCVRVDGKKIRPIRLNTNDDGSYHTPTAVFYSKNSDGSIEKIIGPARRSRKILPPVSNASSKLKPGASLFRRSNAKLTPPKSLATCSIKFLKWRPELFPRAIRFARLLRCR